MLTSGAAVGLRVTSLGGVESLIEHRATVEGPTSPIPQDLRSFLLIGSSNRIVPLNCYTLHIPAS